MSYRIWINVFDMPFISTRTESSKEAALGIAKALSSQLPNSVVGVDSVENVDVLRNETKETHVVLCAACQKDNKKSIVHSGISMSTMISCPSFFDEEGRQHKHDTNKRTTDYHCSEGHRWGADSYMPCWCGWKYNPQERTKA